MRPIRYSTGSRVIRVDTSIDYNDPETLETFEEVDENPRAYKNRPAQGRIPGFGEKYDTCGEKDPHFCSECGEPLRDKNGGLIEIGRTCWRKDCPRCSPGWAMKRSYGITAKLEDYRKHISSQRNGNSPKFHHVTLIPPYKDGETTFATNTEDPLDSAYQIAKVILNELGAFGGMIAYHPFSGTGADDRGEWKRRLFNQRDWEGDVREELHYRAHFHAIVVADSIDHLACKHLYDQTGWVTHRIEKENSNVSLYGKKDLASAVTYALSHAGTGDEISDTYRYFGEVAQHTASEQVKQEMKRIVRAVAPSTLDIDLGTTTCNRTTDQDNEEANPYREYVPRGTTTASDTTTASSHSDEVKQTDSAPKCGGRLVPLEHAQSFLDDVQFDTQLEQAYESWTGSAIAD